MTNCMTIIQDSPQARLTFIFFHNPSLDLAAPFDDMMQSRHSHFDNIIHTVLEKSKKFPVGSRISIDTMIETEQEPALGGTPTMHVGVEGFDRD